MSPKSDVRPIPEGYRAVTPYLVVNNAREALAFYEKALGATTEVLMPMPGGDRVMHSVTRVGDSLVMVGDEWPEMPHSPVAPTTAGAATGSLLIYCDDVDAAFKRAVDAGCQEAMAPQDMFWGDRFAKVIDPYGHHWQLATHVEDVPPEEMERRALQAFGGGQ